MKSETNAAVSGFDYLVAIIAKCPGKMSVWRFGPEKFQDWLRSIVKAVEHFKALQAKGFKVKIFITTAFHKNGCPSEADIYAEYLRKYLNEDDFILLRQGFHTGDQVHYAEAFAKKHDAKLIMVSTVLHFPHVFVHAMRSTKHVLAIGSPCLWEGFKDPLMAPIAWVLYRRFNWWHWFNEQIEARRENGQW